MRTSLLTALLVLLSIGIPLALAHGGNAPYPESLHKIIDYNNQLAASITFLVAFLAGIISFTSPCGAVLLPTFFTFWFKERKKAVAMTAAFSFGLLLAFAALGLIAGIFGDVFGRFRLTFISISGFALILFGILALLNKGFSLLAFKIGHQPKDWLGITTLGFFFGIGWTPCISPILSGMFILAAGTGTLGRSVLLMMTFALGVALPLLILAAVSDRYDWANANWLRGRHITFRAFGRQVHTHTYNIVSGALLITIGTVMLLTQGTAPIEQLFRRVWSMNLYNNANDALVAGMFSTTWAQAVGILLALIVLGIIIWKTRHPAGPTDR